MRLHARNYICVCALLVAAAALRAQDRAEIRRSAVVNAIDLSRQAEPDSSRITRYLHAPKPTPHSLTEIGPSIPAISDRAAAEAAGAPSAAPSLSGFPALLDDFRRVPPDTTGAVGPQHVVTMLNSQVQFQTRTGKVLTQMTLDKFWSQLGPLSDTCFDPHVLYDPFGQRWIASAAADAKRPSSALLIAVSQTGDPTGNWNMFKINIGSTGNWADYPVLGFSANWVALSINLFSADTYVRTNLYVFNKAALYGGSGAPYVTFQDNTGTFVPVVDYDNVPNRMFFMQTFTSLDGTGSLRVSDVQGQAGSEKFTPGRGLITVRDGWAFTSTGPGDFLPQRGSSVNIDAGDARLQNCMFRNSSVWCAHTIFLPAQTPTRSAVQWWQVDPVVLQVQQRGRIDDPSGQIFYAYGTVAVNKNNDALIGYSSFSLSQYASANYSFRSAGDPPNTLQADTVFKPGEASYVSGSPDGNRWGDYSGTMVDPVDDLSFWTIQEYAATPPASLSGAWGTWWAQVTPSNGSTTNCTYSLAPGGQLFPGVGGSGSVSVTAPSGCSWMAAGDASWVSIDSGSPGNGNGTVNFSVSPNPSTSNLRTATITIGGQTFTLTQSPVQALPDLVVTSLSAPTTGVIGGQIQVSAAVRNQGGLAAGAFRVGMYFSTATTVSTKDVFSGSYCSFTGLNAGSSSTCSGRINVPSTLKPGTYFLGAIADDLGAITEIDKTNNSRTADTGPITLTTGISPPVPSVPSQGVVSAASFAGGPVAPGEIITLLGQNMGPPDLQLAQLNSSGLVDNVLGGTRVLFDGVAAPLIYTQATKVSAVVPFGLAGRSSTQLQVEYQGVRSNPMTIPIASSAPAIFTLDASGKGAGVIINLADGSVNSATQPAARGSYVTIYATGGGQMSPQPLDGQLAPGLATPLLPLFVRIGGVQADVLYGGAAPGLVSGVLQINVRIPDQASTGSSVPVDLIAGNATSPAGVTMAIQ